jgi:prolipoprotein diacylglyceryl transferase
LSIPSPSAPWQVFDLAAWLRDTLHITAIPANFAINLRASTACIVVGIIVALIITSRRLTRRGGEPGVAVDVVVWAIPLGIIGARVVHVLSHYQDYFGTGKNPVTALQFWLGGMSVFGAILGGLLGVLIACAIDGLRVGSVLDAAVPGTLFALAAERLGDWFDWQYFGTPTTLPWGLQVPANAPGLPVGLPAGTLYSPTFLYELLWDLAGIAVLLFVGHRLALQWGRLFALLLVWYGLGRSWFESLRIDPSLHFAGIRTNVWLGWIAALVGIIVFFALARRHPGQEPSVYRQGREWSPASAVDSADTYPEVDESKDAIAVAKTPAG